MFYSSSTRGFFSFNVQLIVYFFIVLARGCNGITTTHYNRPPELSRIENKIEKVSFPNISIAERQKRLLPYVNHYLTQNNEPYPTDSQYELIVPSKTSSHQASKTKFNDLMGITYAPIGYETPQAQPIQANIKFTPFLPSNAVPGGFVPMLRPPTQPLEVNYVPFEQTKKMPNYGAIYDKLSQLKLRQSALTKNQVPRYIYTRKPQINYVANFITNTTPQTFVHTYNPTNIDVQSSYNIPQEIALTENPLRVTQLDNPEAQKLVYPVQKQPIQEAVYREIQKQPKEQIYQTLEKGPQQLQEVVYQPKEQIYQTLQKDPQQIQEVVYQQIQKQPKEQIYQNLQKDPQQIQEVVYQPIQNQHKEEIYQTLQKEPQQLQVVYQQIPKQPKQEFYRQLYKPQQLVYTPIQKQPLQEQKVLYPIIQKPRPLQQEELYQTPKQPQYVTIFAKNPQLNYIIQGRKPNHNQSTRQYLQETISTTPKSVVLLPQIQYTPKSVTPKLIYHTLSNKPYTFEPTITHNGHNYEPSVTQTIAPTPTTENPNSLNVILRKLQESNTLPQTITPNNVDNSIKTLVRILNTLKARTKTPQPIIVPDENDYEQEEDNETDVALNNDEKSHRVTTQTFPADTSEGGTPGKPGIDYPALSIIPPTAFNCTTQRYKGFFADPETNCQVWHYCDLNGGQASFLCPNGTIFSQVALTCDWWFNVKCSTTTQLYVLNERLYKYIIPLQPKFPEDYTGPLVDKYLALKFQEMEEKMKEKKEKEGDSDKTEEIDELQLLEDKNNESSTLATNHKK